MCQLRPSCKTVVHMCNKNDSNEECMKKTVYPCYILDVPPPKFIENPYNHSNYVYSFMLTELRKRDNIDDHVY